MDSGDVKSMKRHARATRFVPCRYEKSIWSYLSQELI